MLSDKIAPKRLFVYQVTNSFAFENACINISMIYRRHYHSSTTKYHKTRNKDRFLRSRTNIKDHGSSSPRTNRRIKRYAPDQSESSDFSWVMIYNYGETMIGHENKVVLQGTFIFWSSNVQLGM